MKLFNKSPIEGSDRPLLDQATHLVTQNSLFPPFPPETRQIVLGMGCFWGAEKIFYKLDGIYITAVGYSGGTVKNPTYEEVCTGSTGHAEAVLIVYFPQLLALKSILKLFFEMHDPTQLNRQGNDIGTQYRSLLTYETNEEKIQMEDALNMYNDTLKQAKKREVVTVIEPRGEFYYAEEYHQQYLIKNPYGYCNHGFNGVSCNL